jgi:hypothetical protein
MSALIFIAGILVGAGCILLWAVILGAKAKRAKQASGGFHCATLGDAGIETSDAYLLKQILSEVDKHSLYEIRPRIN